MRKKEATMKQSMHFNRLRDCDSRVLGLGLMFECVRAGVIGF